MDMNILDSVLNDYDMLNIHHSYKICIKWSLIYIQSKPKTGKYMYLTALNEQPMASYYMYTTSLQATNYGIPVMPKRKFSNVPNGETKKNSYFHFRECCRISSYK